MREPLQSDRFCPAIHVESVDVSCEERERTVVRSDVLNSLVKDSLVLQDIVEVRSACSRRSLGKDVFLRNVT